MTKRKECKPYADLFWFDPTRSENKYLGHLPCDVTDRYRYIRLINQCTLVNKIFANEIQILDPIGRVKFYEFMGLWGNRTGTTDRERILFSKKRRQGNYYPRETYILHLGRKRKQLWNVIILLVCTRNDNFRYYFRKNYPASFSSKQCLLSLSMVPVRLPHKFMKFDPSYWIKDLYLFWIKIKIITIIHNLHNELSGGMDTGRWKKMRCTHRSEEQGHKRRDPVIVMLLSKFVNCLHFQIHLIIKKKKIVSLLQTYW